MAAMLIGLPSASLTFSSWVSKLWTLMETFRPAVSGGEDGQQHCSDPDEDRPQGQVLGLGLVNPEGDQPDGHDDSQQADGPGHGPGAALLHVDIRSGGKWNVGGHVDSFFVRSN